MGSPCFIYYPDSDGAREIITWPEPYLTDLKERPLREVDDGYDGARGMSRVVHAGGYAVNIVHERFTDEDFKRQLMTMSAHLEAGGSVGFCTDSAKIFLGIRPSDKTWSPGDSVLTHGGNAFNAWAASGAVAQGDEVVIESANPEMYREFTTVALGVTSVRVPLDDALRYPFGTGQITVVRYADFYPVLKLPKSELGKPIVTHDHRLTWTLDITLEYDMSAIGSLLSGWDYQGGGLPLGTDALTPKNTSGRYSLDSLLQKSHGITRTSSNRATISRATV